MQPLDDFFHFLDHAKTPFHAAAEITARLKKAGFIQLFEKDKWGLKPGQGYFVVRGSSLITAFQTPKKTPISSTILASHIDSPCLKIKPKPEIETRGIGQLATEVYGAPILHSWLDRDLVIAGRMLTLSSKGKKESHLICLSDHPMIIPQLAFHLDRASQEKGFTVQKQDHLKPIFSLSSKELSLQDLLQKHRPFKKLIGFDLFLVPLERASLLGTNKELISSYRLDNLTSSYAALFAMTKASPQNDVLQMAFFWDHEEIGSMSQLGADSCSADQILERISLCLGMDREDYFRLKSRSICLSGDLTHGFHPSFADKYDAHNAPLLGFGPVLKFNANQKYATSGKTSSVIADLAAAHKIPMQTFASRSDIPSGSTVGSIMASQLGIATVDLGIAGWAMHSIRETVSAKDELSLCALFQRALEESLEIEE